MHFKLDENLPSSAVSLFASEDHDAATVVTQDLQGVSDARLADVCGHENRVLVTLDKGFADILPVTCLACARAAPAG